MDDYIVKSPFPDYTPPSCDLWTYLKDSFVTHKDSIALLDPVNKISLTFGETLKKVECIALSLQDLGYDNRRPLVIYMTNCCEFVLVTLAVWKLRGSVAVINHLLTARDVHNALNVLDSGYLLCNQATASLSVKSSLGTSIKGIICTSPHPGCLPFTSLVSEQPRSIRDEAPLPAIDPKYASVYCFSSGTTGMPKCVEISHAAFAECITSCIIISKIDQMNHRGGVIYQPFSHIYGLMLVIGCLKVGQKIIPMPQFNLEVYIKYISEYKLEYLFIVPPIAVLLSKSPLVQKYDMSSVRILSSGAAPLGKDTEEQLRVAFRNNVSVVQGYGMTETAGGGFLVPTGTVNPPQGSIGDVHNALNVLDSSGYLLCNQATASLSVKSSLGTSIKGIICTSPHPGCLPFTSLVSEQPRSIRDEAPLPAIDPKYASVYCFSSGTTGMPKCVEISHAAFAECITSCIIISKIDQMNHRGGVIYQPFSHIYGLMLVIGCLKVGQKIIPMPQFNLEVYIKYISEYKLEYLFIVPPIAVLLSKSPLVQKYDMSSVRILSSGAAPLGKDTEEQLRVAFRNNVSVVQGYGMTETAGGGFLVPTGTVNPPQGSIGRPYANTLAKIIDPESGQSLPPYSKGELCMKANFFMTGYLGNPKATADTISPDGWLHTGDVAYFDKNGFCFVVDRLKELIKYKGYQVAPSELENLILTHNSVTDVGVTYINDEEAGELPQAWVVLKPNASLTEREMKAFVKEAVAPYKQLRGGVKFVNAIPKSPSGKIMRRIMKDTANQSKL